MRARWPSCSRRPTRPAPDRAALSRWRTCRRSRPRIHSSPNQDRSCASRRLPRRRSRLAASRAWPPELRHRSPRGSALPSRRRSQRRPARGPRLSHAPVDSAAYLAVIRRRSRRRRVQRGEPHDRGRNLPGRVHRPEHGHPAAPHVGRSREDAHRPGADTGSRLRRRPGDRTACRRGRLRPDQARPPRLGHGVRHRRRGRRHRLGRGPGRGQHRPRGRRAHRRHRHDALPVRGNAALRHRPTPAFTSCAPCATP